MKNNFNKNHRTALPQLKVAETEINDEILCRFVEAIIIQLLEKDTTKKMDLVRYNNGINVKIAVEKIYFGSKNTDIHTLEMPDSFAFDSDVWLTSHLGLQVSLHLDPHQKGRRIIFSDIRQNFLKLNAKRFVLYKSSTTEFTTINQDYMTAFRSFSEFLFSICFDGGTENINRKIIIDYASYLNQKKLSPKTRYRKLSVISLFFETGIVNDWFQIPSCLVRQEDYPKQVRPLPRYIPEEVMKQLNKHLDALPEPFMRMTLVLQECGLRIGELCRLTLDCLKHDGDGQWRIQFIRWKTKAEDSIPVSQELAKVIQEQQRYIQEIFSSNFKYLFCGRKATGEFMPEPKVITSTSFINPLKKLAQQFEIKDNSGKIWNFQTHQFRHTVGTRMIKAGVPQHIVQRYLGHESPAMTQVYAHIFDETLRKEVEKYHESRVSCRVSR